MEPRAGFEYLWERLKWLREVLLRGMSQRDLAYLIEEHTGFEVSHVSIGRYESEDPERRRIPSADYIEAICTLTNSTYEWVMTGTGPRERTASGLDGYEMAWREAAEELRALVQKFEERAGKRTGPDTEPDEDTPTGPEGDVLGMQGAIEAAREAARIAARNARRRA